MSDKSTTLCTVCGCLYSHHRHEDGRHFCYSGNDCDEFAPVYPPVQIQILNDQWLARVEPDGTTTHPAAPVKYPARIEVITHSNPDRPISVECGDSETMSDGTLWLSLPDACALWDDLRQAIDHFVPDVDELLGGPSAAPTLFTPTQRLTKTSRGIHHNDPVNMARVDSVASRNDEDVHAIHFIRDCKEVASWTYHDPDKRDADYGRLVRGGVV